LKIFIFLLAVLFGVWLWRRNRLNAFKEKQQDKAHNAASQGNDKAKVDLPESDMVKGRAGRYCSESHRQAAGDQLA
jgi:hypothetical protein